MRAALPSAVPVEDGPTTHATPSVGAPLSKKGDAKRVEPELFEDPFERVRASMAPESFNLLVKPPLALALSLSLSLSLSISLSLSLSLSLSRERERQGPHLLLLNPSP